MSMTPKQFDSRHVSDPSRARGTRPRGRKPGRPTKFTPQLGAAVCKLIGLGVPIGAACQVEGVGRTTLRDWRKQGAAGVEPFDAFVVELERALATVEVQVTINVVKASKRDWRAGAWWLERRRPRRYGVKQTLRIEKKPEHMTDEELDAEIARHGYVRVPPVAKETQS